MSELHQTTEKQFNESLAVCLEYLQNFHPSIETVWFYKNRPILRKVEHPSKNSTEYYVASKSLKQQSGCGHSLADIRFEHEAQIFAGGFKIARKKCRSCGKTLKEYSSFEIFVEDFFEWLGCIATQPDGENSGNSKISRQAARIILAIQRRITNEKNFRI